MSGSKHFNNLLLFFGFVVMIGLPFSLVNVKVENDVLGLEDNRNYYKRVVADKDEVLVRTFFKEGNKEHDFVSVQIMNEASYYPIYEISNISDKNLKFRISSDKKALGDLEGKKVSLRVGSKKEVMIFNGLNDIPGESRIDFSLESGERAPIDLIIESQVGQELDSLFSFDLIFEEVE